MSKNKKTDFVKDFLDVLDVLTSDDITLDELLKGTPSKKDSTENLKKAADIVNKGLENEMEKIKNKEKQLLVDSPVDTSKVKNKNKVEVGLEGFIKPEDARAETDAHSVRLINVNKTVNKMLESVESEIIEAANTGASEVTIDFFDDVYSELLYGVRLETAMKVINRLTNYIDSLGYDVDLETWEENTEDEDYEFDVYAHLTISW